MIDQVELPAQYRLGHEKIDSQHAHLFAIFMGIVELMKNQENKTDKKIEEEIIDYLSRLKSYTINHFQFEEHLMEKIKYPDFEAHKKIHIALTEKIIEIQKNAIRLKKEKHALIKEMALFLKGWYLGHILGEDKKIVEFEKTQK